MHPIVVMSHIMKVLEKTILHEIKVSGSNLFETGPYSTGFKE